MSRARFRVNLHSIVAWSGREIWRLRDCNWTQTQNHLVRKRTLNHLAELDKLAMWPNWPVWPNGWVFVYELSGSGFESCSHLNRWLYKWLLSRVPLFITKKATNFLKGWFFFLVQTKGQENYESQLDFRPI